MSRRPAVLIADDDAELSAMLAEQLSAAGFDPTAAGTAAEAEAMLTDADVPFAALILDIGLPDRDGHTLCATLRRRGLKLPILMLTGAAEEEDVVRGLAAGADDYVRKPFRMAELMARLRAQLRSFENTEDAVFAIGPYHFRPAAKLLQRSTDKRRIRLTEKEAAILKFLYRNGQREVRRQELLGEVWGYNAAVATHTLETHVYRLRQKIEADPANPRLLLTGKDGYSLIPAA